MKKTIMLLVCIFSFLTIYAKVGDTLYVSVDTTPVKAGTKIGAKVIGNIEYGDIVSVISENGKWIEIELKGNSKIKGWVSASALTKKKIISSGNKVSADAKELALAGKGFNAQVEKIYSESGNGNYNAVDEMEKTEVPINELILFIEDGQLNGGEE